MKPRFKFLLSAALSCVVSAELIAADITVWDWKSGDPVTQAYYDSAKNAFESIYPDVTVNYVNQPHDQYYELLDAAVAKGNVPDVVLLHGGSKVKSRTDTLLNFNDAVRIKSGKYWYFRGMDAFEDDNGDVYGLPLTIQGFAVYYNKEHYRNAGLDPSNAPTTYNDLILACESIDERGDVPCFAIGNEQGYGGEFFISQVATSTFTDEDYVAWRAGELPWTNEKVKSIVELWVDGIDRGWYPESANSMPKFMAEYEMFANGGAAHTVGLLSDVAHWKQFEGTLGAGNVGAFAFPGQAGVPARLPFGGGIGWGIMKDSKNKDLAIKLVRKLVDADRQAIFSVDAGAVPANSLVNTSNFSSPALAELIRAMSSAPGDTPHSMLNPAVLDEWKRQSKLLISGDISVDMAIRAMESARMSN
jgi:ABC-type glycerol-3-phosphate transport system substrate-binding protein